ncbi:MAG: hypothetical protein L0Y72_19685 [Gemmataceae bacterium]|nr:hypothetical protein [Gemmataceae bacterium]MCI0741259.1 hypothetical protein [Gemmataceae bacterium]
MKKLSCLALVVLILPALADEPCKSGLRENQRPGPYTSLVSVGAQRGTQHCFICEAGDKPMVIVFARNLSEPLGKLVHKLDKALAEHKAQDLRAWVTFLAEDQTTLDSMVVKWGQKHATGNVPLGVFEDVVGPPTYLLAREADVTILLSVKQKVAANFAFRAGELNDAQVAEVLKALPRILAKK